MKFAQAAFAADGKLIATASADRSVCIWNAETGVLLRKLTGHIRVVWGVSFSPDGNEIVTASILTAIGLAPERARASIRFSLGRSNTVAQVDALVDAVDDSVRHLRKISPVAHAHA